MLLAALEDHPKVLAQPQLVCRSCGLTVDTDCAAGTEPCVAPVRAGGFAIDQAQVTFHGLCPGCRT